ncbi:hypothetical protein N9Y89_01805 [bacterium]|nr:hypothetical protein [bacterium]
MISQGYPLEVLSRFFTMSTKRIDKHGKSSLFCKIRAIDSNDARQIISKIHKIEGINRTGGIIINKAIENNLEKIEELYLALNSFVDTP